MKSKPKQKSIIYIKLASLADLCRYACNFNYTNCSVVSVKADDSYRIFAIGERVGKATIAYYINSASQETMISYTYPSSPAESENAHFVKQMVLHPIHGISILDITSTMFKQAASKPSAKDITLVSVGTTEGLISAVIGKSVSSESISQIYEFSYKGKTIMCSFDLIDELAEEGKILYYSVSKRNEPAGFARYKYSDNKVDFTDYMGEHSYMYAKIIHLAEPFPFFKLPD